MDNTKKAYVKPAQLDDSWVRISVKKRPQFRPRFCGRTPKKRGNRVPLHFASVKRKVVPSPLPSVTAAGCRRPLPRGSALSTDPINHGLMAGRLSPSVDKAVEQAVELLARNSQLIQHRKIVSLWQNACKPIGFRHCHHFARFPRLG